MGLGRGRGPGEMTRDCLAQAWKRKASKKAGTAFKIFRRQKRLPGLPFIVVVLRL